MIVEKRYCYLEFASSFGKTYWHLKDDWQSITSAQKCAENMMLADKQMPDTNEKFISYKVTLFIEVGF